LASSTTPLGHRGRQQQGLLPLGHGLEDRLDGRPEPDVEHLVGLVQHDPAHLVEVDRLAVHQVHQPPGGGDDQVAAGGQQPLLPDHRLAPDDGRRAAAAAGGQLLEFAADLVHQLARRRQDQGLGPALAVVDRLDQGDQERGGLAGARRRIAQAVAPGQGRRDHLRLHGAGLLEAQAAHGRQHRLAQTEGVEPVEGPGGRRLQTKLLVTPSCGAEGTDRSVVLSRGRGIHVGLYCARGPRRRCRARSGGSAPADQRDRQLARGSPGLKPVGW
jgi:hypothetical protein